MYISYRKKLTQITSLQSLLDYINQNSRAGLDWKGVKAESLPQLMEWIKSDIIVSHKNLYNEFRTIINSTSNRVFQLDYYLDRGYSLQFAKQQVASIQSARLKKAFKSGSFNDRLLPSHIEYWTSKGLTQQEAEDKVSECQSTFSIERCIEKWGPIKGEQVFNTRQQKWQHSMSKIDFYTGVTWDRIKAKHVLFKDAFKEWLDIAISRRSVDVNNILDELSNQTFNNTDELLEYCLNSTLGLKMNQSILSVLNIDINNWKELWLTHNKITLNKRPGTAGVYGNHYYRNGNYYESDGELELGLLLESLDISFSMHKYYPNMPYKYDFYLPQLDTYIEWTGMDDKLYKDKKTRLNSFNILWTSNIEDVKKIIK